MKRKPASCILLLLLMLLLLLATFGSGCVSESENKSEEIPETSGPGETESGETEPGETESGETESGETESGETEPGASEEAYFKTLMQSANSNYVKALLSTGKKDFNASEKALEALTYDLKSVETRYVKPPPAPYAADETWPETLGEALKISENSRDFLRENDIEAAHLALEPMRALFLDLHRRNGIELMGDRLTNFHTVMELAVDAANENDTLSVKMLIPELEFLWTGVKAAEPPASADEAYEPALAEVEEKIHGLEKAASLGGPEETKKTAEELRTAFSKVFAKYGVVIA
ncbi:MAG: hypothetical protein PHW56_01650 [Methanosarcinaceae archaeon]|nr:hypothetical protein [Methanosarcinaceae archaeon]